MSAPPLLQLNQLSVAFQTPEGIAPAVRKASLEVHAGECVALVGESGSGKSVSALSVLRLLPQPPALPPQGEIFFKGQNLLALPEAKMRQLRGGGISMIFQEPMTSLNPLHRVGQQISEVLQIHSMAGASSGEILARTKALLRETGLSAARFEQAFPHQLSGGQRQRVMIAMALANQPDLLIADEPTTALDVTVQAQILALLEAARKSSKMGMLLITHDLDIVKKVAQRAYVMRDGEIVEAGKVAEIMHRPRHAYTKALLDARPEEEAPPPNPKGAVLLEAGPLFVRFPIRTGIFRRQTGYVPAVEGLHLKMKRGHTIAVVGESGSGKTSLGLALMRLIGSQGPIRFMGQDLQILPKRALRRMRKEMQIVFQDPYASLSPRMSAGEIITEGLKIHERGLSRSQLRDRAAIALEETGLTANMQDRYPHEFSGGQRQRLALARALILKPALMMLDEPTSGLDLPVQARLLDLLRKLQAEHDLAYLFISHDLRVVRALAHEIIIMKDGVCIESGPAKRIFSAPRHDYSRALLAAAFELETSET